MMSPAQVRYIVIHASYTSSAAKIGALEIRRWHKEKGYDDIGYNFVIKRDGELETGRDTNYSGAHTLGQYNNNSIGVCLVGGKAKGKDEWEFNFTTSQIARISKLVSDIKREWPDAKVIGHRDADPKRQCPGFDVKAMFSESGINPWEIYR